MKPQADAFLQKARALLDDAAIMLGVGLSEQTGRTAYLAGFHAAQAYLFEKTDKVFKTHKGVQGEFGRLTKGDKRIGPETRAFLGRGYELKAMADYETGPDAKITLAQAREVLDAAQSFVACLAGVLSAQATERRVDR